jgi:hypothetical protein
MKSVKNLECRVTRNLVICVNIIRLLKSRRLRWLFMFRRQWIYAEFLVGNFFKTFTQKIEKRFEDNIKMDLKEVGCENWEGMELALDRVQWWGVLFAVFNLLIQPPQCSLFVCTYGSRLHIRLFHVTACIFIHRMTDVITLFWWFISRAR